MECNKKFTEFNIKKRTFTKVFLNFLGNLFFIYCVIISIALIFFSLVTMENEVDGPSMQPTLNRLSRDKHDFVYVNLFDHDYNYEDIIVLDNNNGVKVIKRIVGLPGDRIDIVIDNHEYKLERNGEIIVEDYILIDSNPSTITIEKNGMDCAYEDLERLEASNPEWFEDGKYVVKENEVFILGDHRNDTEDSADYGGISMDNIYGKVERIRYYGENAFLFYLDYIKNGEFIKTFVNMF